MTNSIHLQGVGRVEAIHASELHVGMRLMWNFGSVYEVLAIADISPKYIRVSERAVHSATADSASVYERRLKKDRLVAGFWPKAARSA